MLDSTLNLLLVSYTQGINFQKNKSVQLTQLPRKIFKFSFLRIHNYLGEFGFF